MGAISDLHGDVGKAKAFARLIIHKDVDAVVIAGDLTNEGMGKFAKEILGCFSGTRVFAVPGNMDSDAVAKVLDEEGANLHKKAVEFGGYWFVGLGGAKPVNTYYRFNIGELEAKKYLSGLMEGKENIVLISHSPPSGTKISMSSSGFDLGVDAVREAIEKYGPKVCICGHVHESMGRVLLGDTLCVNLGPAKDGNAAIIDLDKMEVERLEI